MGTVTAFEEGVERTSKRAFLGGFGGARNTSTAYLALDLRVVDTSTGEIAYARTIEGRTTKTASSVDVGFAGAGLGYESIKSEATAKAVRAAVIEVIDYLECAMVRRDACLAVYAGKEQQRVEHTRRAIRLDGNTR